MPLPGPGGINEIECAYTCIKQTSGEQVCWRPEDLSTGAAHLPSSDLSPAQATRLPSYWWRPPGGVYLSHLINVPVKDQEDKHLDVHIYIFMSQLNAQTRFHQNTGKPYGFLMIAWTCPSRCHSVTIYISSNPMINPQQKRNKWQKIECED